MSAVDANFAAEWIGSGGVREYRTHGGTRGDGQCVLGSNTGYQRTDMEPRRFGTITDSLKLVSVTSICTVY